jgi:hypothetical protein
MIKDKKMELELIRKKLKEEIERNTFNKILNDYENWIPLMSNDCEEVDNNYYNLDTAKEIVRRKFPIRKIQ